MYKRPLLNELWDELDSVVYRLKTDGWENGPLSAEDHKNWGAEIGQAQGIAYAIALVYDLLNPNIDWVRQEAMRRWEAHLEHPTPISDREVRLDLFSRCCRGDAHRVRSNKHVVGAGSRSRIRDSRVRLGTILRVAGKQGER
jgi:hypothetical protein